MNRYLPFSHFFLPTATIPLGDSSMKPTIESLHSLHLLQTDEHNDDVLEIADRDK
jgi:hypothetical protein